MNRQHMQERKRLLQNHFFTMINTTALCAVMLLSFFLSYFSAAFSATVFVIVLTVFIGLYALTKPWLKHSVLTMSLLWGPAMLFMVYSFARSSHTITGAFDVAMLLLAVMLCIFVGMRAKTYVAAFVTIASVSAVFAIGIILQCYFTDFHSVFLKIFPVSLQQAIHGAKGLAGFTSNTGFSASYICSGIIALLALGIGEKRKDRKIFSAVTLFILAVCLILTCKRGHNLFAYLTLLISFLLSSKKHNILKRCVYVFGITLLIFCFAEALLLTVPEQFAVSSLFRSIADLQAGKDITSSRSALYIWALKLFAENPVLGIGWGDYRTTVVGNATQYAVLDTHNIYLQLLCENGIVGFLCFAVPMLLFWVAALRIYFNWVQKKNEMPEMWRKLVFFSFAYQTFFGLLGLTENPLYDVHTVLVYLLSCGIVVAYFIRSKARLYPSGKQAVLRWFRDSFFGSPAGIEPAEDER